MRRKKYPSFPIDGKRGERVELFTYQIPSRYLPDACRESVIGRGWGRGGLFAATLNDDFGRIDHDFQVGSDGHVVEVEQVVAQALYHLVDV